MKSNKLFRKICVVALATTLGLTSLTGCKKETESKSYTVEEVSTTEVLKIGDYTIYLDELIVYIIQDFYLQGGDSASFDEVSNDYRKMTILSTLRENKILYDVSQKNGVTLDDKDMTTVDTTVNNFKTIVGQELLDKYGISDELINRLFCEQACVAKFENDIRNDMGKTIETDLYKAYENTEFYRIYYMTFPTVEVENGNPKKDESGNYVYVSDDEKKKVEEQAIEAIERMRAGEDYIAIAEEYGIGAYCSEVNAYSGSYSEEMNELIESMKDNDVSDPIPSNLGYNVIYMIKANDTELKDSYVSAMTQDGLEQEYEKLRNNWLASIEIDMTGDMIGTVWDDFDLKPILVDMEKHGILK